MIALPTGTRIWVAAGIADMRRGFTGLSAVAQNVLPVNRLPVIRSSFAASAVTWSNWFGSMAIASVCLRNAWRWAFSLAASRPRRSVCV